MKKHTPEEIVAILHSVTKLSVKDEELDVWQDGDTYPAGIRSFIPGSFTRELLELIEEHLLFGSDE
jgi:hypothetical protein